MPDSIEEVSQVPAPDGRARDGGVNGRFRGDDVLGDEAHVALV
jgi:hypothetical protein